MTNHSPSPFDAADDVITRIAMYARPAFPFAVAAAALVLGLLRGPGAAILALTAGALFAAIALAWRSIQLLVGEADLPADAALGLAPVDDAKKREVLHALKEIEHERSVGKISDEDYRTLSNRYRAEAKEILRRIDATLAPARARAEAIVEAHLRGEPEPSAKTKKKRKRTGSEGQAGNAANVAQGTSRAPIGSSSDVENADDEEAENDLENEASNDAMATSAARGEMATSAARGEMATSAARGEMATNTAHAPANVVCASCGASNDADAAFCKKCGARVAPEGST